VPTESDLRDLLQGEPGAEPRLDTGRIIRRARARRRPKRIAVGALSGLAAVAIVVPVTLSLGSEGQNLAASDQAGGATAPHSEDMSTLQENERADGGGSLSEDPYPDCQLSARDGAAVPSGVELRVTQPEAGGDVELTLVNGSTQTLRGELEGAYLALGAGEEPLGWSDAPLDPVPLVLTPGEQQTITVPLQPVGCGGSTLAGSYGAEVSLGIRLDDGTVVVANSVRTPVVVTAAE
jgi:hypothetical protein